MYPQPSRRSNTMLIGFALLYFAASAIAEENQGRLQKALQQGAKSLKQGKPLPACHAFEEAVRLSNGKSYVAQLGLASARLKVDEPDKAAVAADAAETLASSDAQRAPAAYLAGLAHYTLSKEDAAHLPAAATALERALALDPSAVLARLTLAYVREAQGSFQDAFDLLQEAMPKVPAGGPALKEARLNYCKLVAAKPDLAPLPAEVLEVTPEIEKPTKIYVPDPYYPEAAKANREQGTCIFQAVIDRMGCVRNLQLIEGATPELDAAAGAAVRTWIFEPARKNGEPVDVDFKLTVSFSLR